jgi:DNA polymerase-1
MNSRSPHRKQQPLLPGMQEEAVNQEPENAKITPETASAAALSAVEPNYELDSGGTSPLAISDSNPDIPFEANSDTAAFDSLNAPSEPLTKAKRTKSDPLVIVVDTHAILYQVFHAMPPMTSPGGLPVGAIHGMLRDLLEIRDRYRPDYLFFTFDLSEDTFRNEIYPEYKGHREEMPADLRLQMPLAREALEALQVPILEIPGYEADDIIATIATQAHERGWRCLIVSPDKDCRQLLTDRVQILNLRKQEIFGIAQLKETWGITPEQVVDFQSMVGDSVDNVPGIPLIGPKIAQQLLEQYGTLDEILSHPDAVSGAKRRENMVKYRDQALMSRQLVALRRDVPIAIPWNQEDQIHVDKTKIAELFQTWGFRRLADRFLNSANSTNTTSSEFPSSTPAAGSSHSNNASRIHTSPFQLDSYQLIQTEEALQAICEQMQAASLIAFDSETTSTQARWAKPVGYSFAWGENQAAYIPVRAPLGEDCLPIETVHRYLKPILENPAIRKVGQNLKYDLIVFRGQGINVQGIYFDTMVADYLLDPGQRNHSLDELAKRYFDHETIKISELIGTGKNQKCMDQVPLEQICRYAAEDAEVPWRLAEPLTERLKAINLYELFIDLEMPLIEVLTEMEFNGISIDTERLRGLSQRFETQLERLYGEIQNLAPEPFNPDSPKQLAKVLFEHLHLPVIKKTKTGPSTDVEVLQELAPLHALPAKIIEYRQLAKLKSTYIDALPELVCPETGRVHTSFRQDVAATGRLSSSEPNLQNIPIRTEEGREIRSAFRPSPSDWTLLTADYSQIELRVLAHYCGDPALREAFEKDQDIHQRVAAEVYGVAPNEVTKTMRRSAKAINFGIIYGQSPFGLAKSLQISKEDAASFIDAYFARYPGVQAFILDTLAICKQQGFVSTMLGRRRMLQGVRDLRTLPPEKRRSLTEPERMAVNTIIQGSAADLIKLAMVRIYRMLKQSDLRARLLLQIHDELVFEVHPDDLAKLRTAIIPLMTTCEQLSVPLKVDAKSGCSWADCEPLA